MAQAALEKVGFARNDAAAQYSVQVAAWTAEAVEVWPEPPMGRWGWSRFDRLRPWNGWSSLHGPWADHQVYLSKVRLEIRNLGDGKVVFEATATNEQSWFRADTILPALFEAALTSFPAATPTPHTVIVALPKG
jgi:hypothetical protein